MKNKVTEQSIKNFMSLKSPMKGLGFFSDGYSGDEDNFIKGLEGEIEGCFTGYMVILPKEKANEVFNKMAAIMEEDQEEMMAEDLENFLSLHELEDGNCFLINAEFGSSDSFCSKLQSLCAGEGFNFDEVYLTVQDFKDCEIDLPLNYHSSLNDLQK